MGSSAGRIRRGSGAASSLDTPCTLAGEEPLLAAAAAPDPERAGGRGDRREDGCGAVRAAGSVDGARDRGLRLELQHRLRERPDGPAEDSVSPVDDAHVSPLVALRVRFLARPALNAGPRACAAPCADR